VHGALVGRVRGLQTARQEEETMGRLARIAALFGRSREAASASVLDRLDPRTRVFIEALEARGGPPLYTLPVEKARAFLDTLQAEHAPRIAIPVDVEDETIPAGPTGALPIRIVRPEGRGGPLPVVVYFHGGGWILGDERTHDRLIREIANGTGAAVVFVKYTPSPEARFPVPIEQAYGATKYVAEHAARLGLDASRLAVAGDSVGGNMATVVARIAKELGGPEIRGQVLFYPVTDAGLDTGSYRQFAGGPWLTKRAMEWFFDAYAPDRSDRARPEVSPLRASLDQLRGLPPALVITDENDVLRDEGEAYAHKLMDAGVRVEAVRVIGTIHDFLMLNALADTPPVRGAIALANARIRELLGQETHG
jgi:acetyl esterase